MTSAGNPATLSIRTKRCSLNLVVHRLAGQSPAVPACSALPGHVKPKRPCAAFSRRAVAFPSIKVSCSTRPACFPNRIITCADGESRSAYCPAKLSISRSRSRKSPVKGPGAWGSPQRGVGRPYCPRLVRTSAKFAGRSPRIYSPSKTGSQFSLPTRSVAGTTTSRKSYSTMSLLQPTT
jgi:hypothetical protein